MKNFKKRFIAIILVIIVFFTNISLEELTVLAEPVGTITTADENNLSDSPLDTYVPKVKEEAGELHYILEEDFERREESTKHFLMEDGSGLAVVYANPIHYFDSVTNSWMQINNTLQYIENAKERGYYTNTASDMIIKLADTALADTLVSIELENKPILKWAFTTKSQSNEDGNMSNGVGIGTNTSGNISDNISGEVLILRNSVFVVDKPSIPNFTWREVERELETNYITESIETTTDDKPESATEVELYNQEMSAVLGLTSGGVYENILYGIDVEYVLHSKQLKENIILKNVNAPIDSFAFVLTHTGATIRQEIDGSLSVVDKNTGNVIYVMQAPFMQDNVGAYSNEIRYILETIDESHTQLSFEVDKEWITSEERSWPIVIDPITTTDSFQNIEDTFVTQRIPNEVHGGYGNFMVGYDNTAYGVSRGYLKFKSFPNLEPGDSIYDARIYYYRTSFSSYSNQSFYIVAREAASSWDEDVLTWNNQPDFSQAGEVLDYSFISPLASGVAYFPQYLNVTKVIRKWYSEGSNNKGLVLSLADETVKGNAYFVSGTNANAPQETYPTGYFFYRNALGLESYWTTHSQAVGTAGTGYVNDFNGNLVFLHNDTKSTSVRLGTGVTHVYNVANLNTDTRFGKGWTLDIYQSLLPTTGKINENGFLYVYIDGDGTKHYFHRENGVLKDEDGLGLTITQESSSNGDLYRIIKTKSGEQYVFDIWGQIRRVIDTNGNTAAYHYSPNSEGNALEYINDASGNRIFFKYDSGYKHLISIIDEIGRTTSFGYDSKGYLTSITYPDGTVSRYYYDSFGRLIGAQSADGYKVNYEYINTMNVPQVSKIYETSGASTGRSLKIEYPSVGTTIFTECGLDGSLTNEADNQSITYHFDSYGRTKDLHDEDGYAAMYEYYSEGASNNKLQTEGTMQKTIHSLFLNGGATNDGSYMQSRYTGTDNGSASIDGNIGHLDDKSFYVMRTVEAGSKEWYQQISVKPNTTYTLSGYIKTENIIGNGIGAYISALVGSGTQYSEGIKGTTEAELDNGWTRVVLTFTTGSSQTMVIAAMGIHNCKGSAWFDCMQLEEGECANRYNLITNNSFETEPNGFPYKWLLHEGNSATDKGTTDSSRTGNYSFAIQGILGVNRRLNQSVHVSGKEGDIFTLSGWAKLEAIPDTNVRISAAILYDTGEPKWVNFDLNYYVSGWQYISGIVSTDDNNPATNRNYVRIDIYIFYDNNYNIAYFDDF